MTGKPHPFLKFTAHQLKFAERPNGWMSRKDDNRYPKMTLAKMEKRLAGRWSKRQKGGTDITDKLIIAHRGAPGYAKENTIESFERAVALGADMIEFDVRRTKDNVLIVYHDRLIQGKPVNELVYEEVKQIAGNQGFHLPTVEEVLRWSMGKIRLDVELKEEGYEKELGELLSGHFKEDQFVISSFNEFSLKIIKDNYPRIQVGLLLGKFKAPLWTRISEFFPMERCQKAKADFLVAHFKLLKFGFLERARRSDKSVFVWTVNDGEMIRKLLEDKRVSAIITDQPDLAVSLREKIASKRIREIQKNQLRPS